MGKQCRHIGSCRGNSGLGYAAFEVPFGCVVRAGAHAQSGNKAVPCSLFDALSSSEFDTGIGVDRRIVVVAFPLLDLSLAVCVYDGEGRALASARFTPLTLAVSSRMLSLRKPELVSFMRGIESRRSGLRTRVELSDASVPP